MVDNSIVVSSCKYLLVNAVHSLGINHSERIPNELVKVYYHFVLVLRFPFDDEANSPTTSGLSANIL